jgi:hypothetical protein
MVMALEEKGESHDKTIPYIKLYLEKYEKMEATFPKIMKPIIKLFRKDFDLDEYAKKIGNWDDKWAIWAKGVLDNHNKKEGIL